MVRVVVTGVTSYERSRWYAVSKRGICCFAALPPTLHSSLLLLLLKGMHGGVFSVEFDGLASVAFG